LTIKNRLIFKILISASALAIAFHNTDISALAQIGINLNWPILSLAVLASVGSVTLLGLRWRQILQPIASAPFGLLVRAQYIGLFGNNVFPLRAGEFMRADYVRKQLEKGFISVLATVFFERLLDLLCVGIVFGILIVTTSITYLPLDYEAYYLAGALLFTGIVIVFVQNRTRIINLLVQRFPNTVGVKDWLSELLTYRAICSYLLLSAMVWTMYALRFQLVLLSVDLPIDPGLISLLLVATAAGFMIPAAPGAIGTYHMAVVFAMHNLYGIDLITAQAASIFLHLSGYIPSTAIGFIAFIGSSASLRDAGNGK